MQERGLSAAECTEQIRAEIFAATNMTASAGIASNMVCLFLHVLLLRHQLSRICFMLAIGQSAFCTRVYHILIDC